MAAKEKVDVFAYLTVTKGHIRAAYKVAVSEAETGVRNIVDTDYVI